MHGRNVWIARLTNNNVIRIEIHMVSRIIGCSLTEPCLVDVELATILNGCEHEIDISQYMQYMHIYAYGDWIGISGKSDICKSIQWYVA